MEDLSGGNQKTVLFARVGMAVSILEGDADRHFGICTSFRSTTTKGMYIGAKRFGCRCAHSCERQRSYRAGS
jgi:hypothetical protein